MMPSAGRMVLVYDVRGKVPKVFGDDEEAGQNGVNAQACEAISLDEAMHRSVSRHHDWAAKARQWARLRVVKETGRPITKFKVDVESSISPDERSPKLPRSVRLPSDLGGDDCNVVGAHAGRCVCEKRHPTMWLDVEGGLMVTRCPLQKKFLWAKREKKW